MSFSVSFRAVSEVACKILLNIYILFIVFALSLVKFKYNFNT